MLAYISLSYFRCMNVLTFSIIVTSGTGDIESASKDFYYQPFSILCRKLLSENKHVKYLYIPYTDSVVVVRCNPVSKWKGPPKFKPQYTKDEAIQHVRDLYQESLKKYGYNYTLSVECKIYWFILTCWKY